MSKIVAASAKAKLARANDLLAELDRQVQAYRALPPVRFASRTNLEDRLPAVKASYYVRSIESPPDVMALLCGDILNNTRAALDHLIWALATARKGKSYVLKHGGRLQFPAAIDEETFPDDLSRFLSQKDIDGIKRVQPYASNDPHDDLIRVMSQLNNVDKHRFLHIVVLVMNQVEVKTRPRLPNGRVEITDGGPLRRGAEAVRFTATRPPGAANVALDASIAVDISIDVTETTKRVWVSTHLHAMCERVAEVHDLFGI